MTNKHDQNAQVLAWAFLCGERAFCRGCYRIIWEGTDEERAAWYRGFDAARGK